MGAPLSYLSILRKDQKRAASIRGTPSGGSGGGVGPRRGFPRKMLFGGGIIIMNPMAHGRPPIPENGRIFQIEGRPDSRRSGSEAAALGGILEPSRSGRCSVRIPPVD
jgi:hypothetical protein